MATQIIKFTVIYLHKYDCTKMCTKPAWKKARGRFLQRFISVKYCFYSNRMGQCKMQTGLLIQKFNLPSLKLPGRVGNRPFFPAQFITDKLDCLINYNQLFLLGVMN